jgi:hypothetical protein
METSLLEKLRIRSLTGSHRVQERDAAIVLNLLNLQPASRAQVERLHFPCRAAGHVLWCDCYTVSTSVKRRLNLLSQLGLVSGFNLAEKQLMQGWVYTVTPEYEKALLKEDRLREAIAKIKYRMKRVNAKHARLQKMILAQRSSLEHHLLVNDIYIWFALSEKMLRQQYPYIRMTWKLHGNVKDIPELPVIPDAVANIMIGEKVCSFYVEADRATETSGALKDKFYEYLKVLRQKQNAVVLFVTDKRGRLNEHVFKAASVVPGDIRKRLWFSVYNRNDLSSVRTNAMTDPVWLALDRDKASESSKPFGLRYKMFPESFRK